MQNRESYIAEEFILNTDKSVFLTGKAGTGKTTLLHKIVKETKKNHMVIAPTGVAAINAGGMTIHSTFQLPLTAFIPEQYSDANPSNFTDWNNLNRNHKVRKEKIQLFNALELLIIDEISMVRADLLDAIDFSLRKYRRNPAPFGGVQVLAIGDLFQLSPVIRNHEWSVLQEYYENIFFYSSQAWQQTEAIKIELQKVYRQEDENFIQILNNIRIGNKVESDIEVLNSHFNPSKSRDKVVTLTTHNYKADKINNKELANINYPEETFKAEVEGKFYESSFPTLAEIDFKVGAQVMFIRNDSEGAYFNGKIGKIKEINDEIIKVKCEGDTDLIEVGKVEWLNSKYTLDNNTKEIKREDIGSFKQIPLKLAWAVTVHKSQGLTFEKCIVDLESTFAPGQLYVALSRCRSLEGLFLSSYINADNIIVDSNVLSFYKDAALQNDVETILENSKLAYNDKCLLNAFSFSKVLSLTPFWETELTDLRSTLKADAIIIMKDINVQFSLLENIMEKFKRQQQVLFDSVKTNKLVLENINERANKAIHYFTNETFTKIIEPLETHYKSTLIKANVSKYRRAVKDVLDEVWYFVQNLYTLKYRENTIYKGEIIHIRAATNASKPQKKPKGETYSITLKMFKEGKKIEEIAEERSMAKSTIEGHFSKFIKEKKVGLFDIMELERGEKLLQYVIDNPMKTSTEIKTSCPTIVSYSEIRWVFNHIAQSKMS